MVAAGLYAPARAAEVLTRPAKITFDPAGALVVDGQRKFPINLTVVPGPDAKAPNGRPAYADFADCGVMFMRSGGPAWNDDTIKREKAMQAAAAAGGLRCCPWLGWDLSNFDPGDRNKEAKLRKVVATFKDSPGMGLWKGADEPDWGNSHPAAKSTPQQVVHVAQMLNMLDTFDLAKMEPAPRAHFMAETMKLAFADRAHWLGDPDFAPVPRGLIDPAYAKSLAARIDPARASTVAAISGLVSPTGRRSTSGIPAPRAPSATAAAIAAVLPVPLQ